jgi:hypothetical protein
MTHQDICRMMSTIHELEDQLRQTFKMYDRGKLHYSECDKAARELAKARNLYFTTLRDVGAHL